MAYKKTKVNQVPKRERKSEYLFEGTEEWKMMKRDIDKGLKPNEALQVQLTAEDKEKYGIKSRRTIARFVKRYLDENELPYTVKAFNRDAMDYIVVQYTPVISRTA